MPKITVFYNWTDEDFTHTWDNESYEFKAKKEIHLPEGLARHFAKHLADREMNRQGINSGRRDKHAEFVRKSLVSVGEEEKSDTKLEVEIANADKEKKEYKCDSCDKVFNTEKGLALHSAKIHTEEEKFEGLE